MQKFILGMDALKIYGEVMKQTLTLAQASLPEVQFKAFRQLIMDYFAEARRSLFKDRRGLCEPNGKGGGAMSE